MIKTPVRVLPRAHLANAHLKDADGFTIVEAWEEDRGESVMHEVAAALNERAALLEQRDALKEAHSRNRKRLANLKRIIETRNLDVPDSVLLGLWAILDETRLALVEADDG